MSSSSEIGSDTGYIESIPSGTEAKFLVPWFCFFYEKSEICSVKRGENFINELRPELIFPDTVSYESFLWNITSDNGSSFKGYEIFKSISVKLKIIYLFAFVRIKNHFLIIGLKSEKFARYLESMWTNTILETISITNNTIWGVIFFSSDFNKS